MFLLTSQTNASVSLAVNRLGYDICSIQNMGSAHLWAVIGKIKEEEQPYYAVWTYNAVNEPEPLGSGTYMIQTYEKALKISYIKANRHAT